MSNIYSFFTKFALLSGIISLSFLLFVNFSNAQAAGGTTPNTLLTTSLSPGTVTVGESFTVTWADNRTTKSPKYQLRIGNDVLLHVSGSSGSTSRTPSQLGLTAGTYAVRLEACDNNGANCVVGQSRTLTVFTLAAYLNTSLNPNTVTNVNQSFTITWSGTVGAGFTQRRIQVEGGQLLSVSASPGSYTTTPADLGIKGGGTYNIRFYACTADGGNCITSAKTALTVGLPSSGDTSNNLFVSLNPNTVTNVNQSLTIGWSNGTGKIFDEHKIQVGDKTLLNLSTQSGSWTTTPANMGIMSPGSYVLIHQACTKSGFSNICSTGPSTLLTVGTGGGSPSSPGSSALSLDISRQSVTLGQSFTVTWANNSSTKYPAYRIKFGSVVMPVMVPSGNTSVTATQLGLKPGVYNVRFEGCDIYETNCVGSYEAILGVIGDSTTPGSGSGTPVGAPTSATLTHSPLKPGQQFVLNKSFPGVGNVPSNVTLYHSGNNNPTYYMYKVNSTTLPGKTPAEFSSGTLNLIEDWGYRIGDNEVYVQACNIIGCSPWSSPIKITISGYADGSSPTSGSGSTPVSNKEVGRVTTGQNIGNLVIPNDPPNNASGLSKPIIDSSLLPSSVPMGTQNLYRFWQHSPSHAYERIQMRVNSTIVEKKFTITPGSDFATNTSVLNVFEFVGFKIGNNELSVRFCNSQGCGPWSDTGNLNVTNTFIMDPACHTKTMGPANGNLRVVAKAPANQGTVYKVHNNHPVKEQNLLFSSDSDFGAIATYLGAPVGSIANLTFFFTGDLQSRCGNSYVASTNNGIVTSTYSGDPKKINVSVQILNPLGAPNTGFWINTTPGGGTGTGSGSGTGVVGSGTSGSGANAPVYANPPVYTNPSGPTQGNFEDIPGGGSVTVGPMAITLSPNTISSTYQKFKATWWEKDNNDDCQIRITNSRDGKSIIIPSLSDTGWLDCSRSWEGTAQELGMGVGNYSVRLERLCDKTGVCQLVSPRVALNVTQDHTGATNFGNVHLFMSHAIVSQSSYLTVGWTAGLNPLGYEILVGNDPLNPVKIFPIAAGQYSWSGLVGDLGIPAGTHNVRIRANFRDARGDYSVMSHPRALTITP